MSIKHAIYDVGSAGKTKAGMHVTEPDWKLDAKRYAYTYAQHGPVRILFKDGKPVPQEQQNG